MISLKVAPYNCKETAAKNKVFTMMQNVYCFIEFLKIEYIAIKL
jgi:hypothetical protein